MNNADEGLLDNNTFEDLEKLKEDIKELNEFYQKRFVRKT